MTPALPHPPEDLVRPTPTSPVPAPSPASRSHRRRPARGLPTLALTVLLGLVLAGCTSPLGERPGAAASDEPTTAAMPFNSEFSRDGTFQSHIALDGIDYVFTMWAAKATPRTAEWRPGGEKYFSFTFQGYDTRAEMRDPFSRKRLIWLERVQVSSTSTAASGASESPYLLDEWAPDVTFDPEARTSGRKGMLITSPKGAFELRNQVIGDLADDTEGVTLSFRAVVHVQEQRGSKKYLTREVTLQIPVAIFASDAPTRPQPVPYNAA